MGGGYDLYGRIVARFIGNYIPGKPSVTVRNMPGAGSLTSVIYVATSAPTDGTVIGIFNPGIITDAISRPGRSKINFTELAWIGSATDSFRMCNVWHGSGIKNYEDLGATRVVTFGASGVGSGGYNDVAILKNLMKLNVRPILGYPGRAEVHLAMERGEVDGRCGYSWSSAVSTHGDWIRDKKMNVLVQIATQKHRDLPNVPLITDLADNAEDKQVLEFVFSGQVWGRPFLAPPGVPADRVKALQDSFMAVTRDPAFIAEANKLKLEINPVPGPELARLIAVQHQMPPQVIKRAKEATN